MVFWFYSVMYYRWRKFRQCNSRWLLRSLLCFKCPASLFSLMKWWNFINWHFVPATSTKRWRKGRGNVFLSFFLPFFFFFFLIHCCPFIPSFLAAQSCIHLNLALLTLLPKPPPFFSSFFFSHGKFLSFFLFFFSSKY